ncbi:MAG: hypothetical protein PUC46_07135 [Lachnospiraceae bacterium]|nr:hypothetical protein [Lachnospiraceae bacterium]
MFKGKPTGEHEQHNANNLFHNWSAGRYLQTPPLKSSAGIVNSGAPLFFCAQQLVLSGRMRARKSSKYPTENFEKLHKKYQKEHKNNRKSYMAFAGKVPYSANKFDYVASDGYDENGKR